MSDSFLPRSEYRFSRDSLRMHQADSDPLQQFDSWYREEVDSKVEADTPMTLATADADGQSSCRVVLLKRFGPDGFLFFSDYRSRKAVDLQGNHRAALLFHWDRLQRQVRIEGTVERVSRAISQDYFSRRPRRSQAGAAASHQSAPMVDRDSFEEEVDRLTASSEPIACPQSWGGFLLVPHRFEFWQGQPGRIHDRVLYLVAAQGWQRSELQP